MNQTSLAYDPLKEQPPSRDIAIDFTYHLANSSESGCITVHQWAAILHAVGRGNGNGVRNDNVGRIPASRHRPAKSVENLLSFTSDALTPTRLTIHRITNGLGLTRLQGTGIEGLDGRLGIGERWGFGGIRRRESEELE